MFILETNGGEDKSTWYRRLASQAEALFAGETDFIANAANCAALLFHSLPGLNWAGFYRKHDEGLVLGPFQGKPACVRIPHGKGVCGAAVFRRRTVLVENVHEFPGHIACDSASRSEIVVPLIKDGCLWGVLDLDSPILKHFDPVDQAGLENLVEILLRHSDLK